MTTKLHLISFETKDKLPLPGLLYEPKRKSKKVVIWLHGMGSTSVFYSTDKMNTMARGLTRNGYAFFPFNNRGAHLIKGFKNKRGKYVNYGTAHEKIKDSIKDIDAAISFLWKKGYREIYLAGHSTGANKVCVYDYYKKRNRVKGYILLGGGDDTGHTYEDLGKRKFWQMLEKSKKMIKARRGEELIPGGSQGLPVYTYQSFYDIANPDGDYNIFAFVEAINNLKLVKRKKLFREFANIKKPTLVVYGSEDNYCTEGVEESVAVLWQESKYPEAITFNVIEGADHSFTGMNKELTKVLIGWLKSL